MKLVPDASGSVMWDSWLPSLFLLLCQIVQKKVNENGIDLCLWMRTQYFSADYFHGPDAAATQLDFPAVSGFYGLKCANRTIEGWTVGQAT